MIGGKNLMGPPETAEGEMGWRSISFGTFILILKELSRKPIVFILK